MPTLIITLIFHAGAAFLQYGQAMKGNGAAYYFACAVNALLASIGMWCLLFATDGRDILRRVPLLRMITNCRPDLTRYLSRTARSVSNFTNNAIANERFPVQERRRGQTQIICNPKYSSVTETSLCTLWSIDHIRIIAS